VLPRLNAVGVPDSSLDLSVMKVTTAAPVDLRESVDCLARAFAQDPITQFLLESIPTCMAAVSARNY